MSRYPYADPDVKVDPHLRCWVWRIAALVSIGFWIGVGAVLYLT